MSFLSVHCDWQVDEVRGTVSVKNVGGDPSEPPKTFTFDIAFGPDCKQLDVYNQVARPVVDCVLEGYNGLSIFPCLHQFAVLGFVFLLFQISFSFFGIL